MGTQPTLPRCSVFIATSLDGYIARPNGSLDWLVRFSQQSDEEDYGYGEFFSRVEALIIGRNTFQTALSFPKWPYDGKKVIVLSHNPILLPDHLDGKAESRQDAPMEIIQNLGLSGFREVYIDGGKTVQSFLTHGLVDELTLNRVPVLVGKGIPLFGELRQDIELEHVRTTAFSTGLVQSVYRRG
jgi:dihydrofolate reductase